MTKDDLRTGMVVELRNGDVCLVIGGNFVDKTTHIPIDAYNYGLAIENNDKFDVLRIYKEPKNLLGFDSLKRTGGLKLLWERQEKSPIQLEIEELEKEQEEYNKKFNDRIEQLKQKL